MTTRIQVEGIWKNKTHFEKMKTSGIGGVRLLLLIMITIGSLVNADSIDTSLKAKITQSLEQLLAEQALGIENCENKCDKAFNRFAYQVSTTNNQSTFEFQACVIGCNQCQSDLAENASAGNCFEVCKNFDYAAQGILKGVIEPDKACLGGCIINTCQVICEGGTTQPETNANKALFYPNGGCSIKTAPYSQYSAYVPFDSPNTAQAGSQAVASCCANALSLCQYVGKKDSANYKILLQKTAHFCHRFVSSDAEPDICAFFNTPRNCGTT